MAHLAITRHPRPVRVVWRGHVVAASERALDLVEGGGRPVLYVPRADADMGYFTRTARTTRCPWKGEAGYFTLHHGAERADDAVWTYEQPVAAAAAIAGHLAFYPDQVTVEEA